MTVACHILDVPCRWAGPDEEEFPLLFTTERRIVPDLTAGAPIELANEVFSIFHTGTHGSYVNLIEGNADFILVARSPSEDELTAARDAGVSLDVRPVALDAFVFLVNDANRVANLDQATLRAIYSGDITDWADAGGASSDIHPYTRNPNSGSQELMEKLVMQGKPTIDAPDMMLPTMMGPINAIEEDSLGIGYSVFFYATFMFPHEHVKLIAVDGVMPTSETIATGQYPLATEVYAVVREDQPAGSTAVMLRDWLLTEAGQATIAESGYVPLP